MTKKETELVRDARLLAEWSDQIFVPQSGFKENEKMFLDSPRNKLWAMQQSLDAATRLFKEHNIPIPLSFRALRMDLHEAFAGRKTEYFESAARTETSQSMIILKAYAAIAIDLLKQAGEGNIPSCCEYAEKFLKKNGLDLKELTDMRPSHKVIKEWRKKISSTQLHVMAIIKRSNSKNEKGVPYTAKETQGTGAEMTAQYIRLTYNMCKEVYGGKDKNPSALKKSAQKLLIAAAAGFPGHLKKV